MKILHISDLHIGKRINMMPMIDDQKHVFDQIVQMVRTHHPKAVILAGDIYDKAVPSSEAVNLFDHFLSQLTSAGTMPLVIYGNHDSAERLAFGNSLLERAGCFVSPVYDGNVRCVQLVENDDAVDVYLLPFIKPVDVRATMNDDEQQALSHASYTDALSWAVGRMPLLSSHVNILAAHQFITGAEHCESEDQVVGGLDNVDYTVFDHFDYVALGHLHRPQFVGREHVRYSGSPLKYSFSEVDDEKSVTLLDIHQGQVNISTLPLKPLHEWFDIRGSFEELIVNQLPQPDGFVRITLTNEDDVYDAFARLRMQYPNLLEMRYDNKRTQAVISSLDSSESVVRQSPIDIFGSLYALQSNGENMTDEQKEYIQSLINQIWKN